MSKKKKNKILNFQNGLVKLKINGKEVSCRIDYSGIHPIKNNVLQPPLQWPDLTLIVRSEYEGDESGQ